MCVCTDHVQHQQREVMLKLKQVVDKQRDDLRAKVQEIATISKEVEAVRRLKYYHTMILMPLHAHTYTFFHRNSQLIFNYLIN